MLIRYWLTLIVVGIAGFIGLIIFTYQLNKSRRYDSYTRSRESLLERIERRFAKPNFVKNKLPKGFKKPSWFGDNRT
jgi:hypothetical protein